MKPAAVAAALAFALLAAAAVWWKGTALVDKVLDLRYGATVRMPASAMPRDEAEARRQDLAVLAQLPTVDRSFDDAARARFEDDVARLRARADRLDRAQFLLGVAAAVAHSGNAHTNVDGDSWRARLNSVPVRLAWFEDGLYVVAADEARRGLLGARVLGVDGLDPESLVREAATYFAGTPEYVRVCSLLLIESPEALHALHPEASADRWIVRIEDMGGARRQVVMPALAPRDAPPGVKPGRLLSPLVPAAQAPGRWHGLLADRPLPASLRAPELNAYAQRFGADTLYLHLWQIRDPAQGTLEASILQALGSASDPPWKRIVLDLRFDAGGDYPTVYGAMKALARRLAPDGRLVILEDNTTFSAAIITVVLARHFAGAARTTLVGDKPGDRLAFWAEGTPMTLPHSGIRIGVSTGFHDWQNGCTEWRCWWPNLWYGVAGGSVDPQVMVRWRFADYRRGVDNVLEQALSMDASP